MAQPAPSPQAGEIVFPVEQAGLEEKATPRVEGKKISMLLQLVLHSMFPAGSLLSALTPGSMATSVCVRPFVLGSEARYGGETSPPSSPPSCSPLLVVVQFCR